MATKIEGIVEQLDQLTLLEAAQLSKLLQEKWGVSAAASVVAAVPGTGAPGGGAAAVEEEIVDEAPKPVKEKVTKAEAQDMKKKLEEVGATVEIR
jgi:large subunit ribosomal protein L7/L12